MPVVWTKYEFPLGGLDTFTDSHHVAPGRLVVLENARFDNPPGINKRHGYTQLTSDTLGGADLSDVSRLYDHNGEVLIFDATALKSLSFEPNAWLSRGVVPHIWLERDGVLADARVSVGNGDTATNQGVTVVSHNATYSITVYDGAGHVLTRSVDPELRSAKLISVGNYIYAFANISGALKWARIDVTTTDYDFTTTSPADPMQTLAGVDVETVAPNADLWDVCAIGDANYVVAYQDASDNTVRVNLFNTSTNATLDSENTGEAAVEAVSVRGTLGEQVWVFYAQATPRLRGAAYAVTTTTLTSTLAPTSVATAPAPTVRNVSSIRLTATTEGVIWTYVNDSSAPIDNMDDILWKTITTTGTVTPVAGTDTVRLEDCTLLTRPWSDDGSVYAAVAFNDLSAAQGTGYIIRWGQDVSGGVETVAGWYGTFCRGQLEINTNYFLPHVVAAGSQPWDYQFPCRVRNIAVASSDEDTNVLDTTNVSLDRVLLDFEPTGRYMSATWGPGMFIAGARPSWYDGVGVTEHGFAWYPTLRSTDVAFQVGAGLSFPATYQIALIYEHLDRNNMIARSVPSDFISMTTAGAQGGFDVTLRHDLKLTERTGEVSSATPPQLAAYRTINDGSIMYRASKWSGAYDVTDAVKGVGAGTPGSDAEIPFYEVLYTTGDILDNAGTPPCKYVLRHEDRLWLAGMENPNQLWFSQPFVETETPRFSEALILDIGERVTALASMDEKLIVFSTHNVYQIQGKGPPAVGGVDIGFDISLVTGDTGCNEQRSVVTTPRGVMFLGYKGIYMLTRSMELVYVGAPVQDLVRDFPICTSAVLLSRKNEVRFTVDDQEDGRILHYNYFIDQWSVDILSEPAAAAVVSSVLELYLWATQAGAFYAESIGAFEDPDSAFIPLKATTPWIAMDTKQGWQRIRSVSVLGRSGGSHGLRVRIAYDYDEDNWAQDETFTAAEVAALDREQVKVRFAKQKCQAFRVEVTDTVGTSNTEGLNLTSLVFEIGLKKGTAKLPAAQKK